MSTEYLKLGGHLTTFGAKNPRKSIFFKAENNVQTLPKQEYTTWKIWKTIIFFKKFKFLVHFR